MKRREFLETMGVLGTASWLSLQETPARAYEPTPPPDNDHAAIAIHPDNPRYFVFRGRPLVLLAATEHYGSIVNRRFNFERYLRDAAARKQTVTRTFLLFREQQSARNPYSPIKPESPDYVTPWPRTGPGVARDGEPQYDLDRWNSEYFDRLHRFLSLASKLSVVVELTVFSNTYADSVWELNPLHEANNLQKVGAVKWQEYISQRNHELFARQVAFARKVVQETSSYDNVYYEICNEPGGGFEGEPSLAEVDAWQNAIARVLRDELAALRRPHLISGQNAFSYQPEFSQSFDASYSETMFDIVNVHPLPHLLFKGRRYELGNFMSKELQLADFRDFFLAITKEAKPSVSDEDNAASLYMDDTGWTIHRKRAWMAVMCGAHYNYIDFSIQSHLETGTDESQKKIRSWIQYLSQFIHNFDFVKASTAQDWVVSVPKPLVAAGLAISGKDYVLYLADSREVAEPTDRKPIAGYIELRLPEGYFTVRSYSPVTGEYFRTQKIRGGVVQIDVGTFTHDLALRISFVS
jgi:hypothetical protein